MLVIFGDHCGRAGDSCGRRGSCLERVAGLFHCRHADAAVRESTERVRAAIKACGFTMPGDKVVVNLAPSSIRKAGSGFDLPIAAAILAATKQIDVEALGECLLVGELGLDGSVRPVHGTLAFARLRA